MTMSYADSSFLSFKVKQGNHLYLLAKNQCHQKMRKHILKTCHSNTKTRNSCRQIHFLEVVFQQIHSSGSKNVNL